jgi:excisionase family DNA binding protein
MGVSRSRIYQLLRAGELAAYKDGRRTLFLVSDIEARIARLPRVSPPPTPTGSLMSLEDRRLARQRATDPDTGPLLPAAQQQIAIDRATEPEPDWAAVYTERLQLLRPDVGEDEARARAYDFTVSAYRAHHNCGLEAATAAVLAAIKRGR